MKFKYARDEEQSLNRFVSRNGTRMNRSYQSGLSPALFQE